MRVRVPKRSKARQRVADPGADMTKCPCLCFHQNPQLNLHFGRSAQRDSGSRFHKMSPNSCIIMHKCPILPRTYCQLLVCFSYTSPVRSSFLTSFWLGSLRRTFIRVVVRNHSRRWLESFPVISGDLTSDILTSQGSEYWLVARVVPQRNQRM